MKKIFNFAIILTAVLSLNVFTSCEDFFTAENRLVTTNLEPNDTLYSVMGIVRQMQNLATRSVLFGELRADLVEANPQATSAIQDISANNITVSNEYNKPADYYAVINDCNIYLANVDTALTTHGMVYYEKEILAVKIFRAWTYLELAKNYGNVPFITEPVLTSADAEDLTASAPRQGMQYICEYFIKELEDYMSYNYRWSKNLALRPSYDANFANVSVANFFIPVRVMLGELNLWLGSCTGSTEAFKKAAGYYHDFLTFTNEEHPVGYNKGVTWPNQKFSGDPQDNYTTRFKMGNLSDASTDIIAYIPMDTLDYYGISSELRSVFNATFTNDYYSQVAPSPRLRSLSADPWYCYLYTDQQELDTLYAPRDTNLVDKPDYIGDLRLCKVCNVESVLDKYHSYNSARQYILKYTEGSSMTTNDERLRFVTLYRYSMIYLHMAEALNHAGFPETAFAVLKYGLTEDVLKNRDIISQEEYDGLTTIKTIGFSTPGGTNSFVDWDRSIFVKYDPTMGTLGGDPNQVGIHDFGCGNSPCNAHYVLPHDATIWAQYDKLVSDSTTIVSEMRQYMLEVSSTLRTHEDSVAYDARISEYKAAITAKHTQAQEEYKVANAQQRLAYPDFVAQKILDEEAIEGMFEGYRFYDLMRWAMYNHDNAYIANEVGKRSGAKDPQPVPALLNSWYIPLPTR